MAAYKQCVECRLTFKTVDGFFRSSLLPDGFYAHCKRCVNKNRPSKKSLQLVPVTEFDEDEPAPATEAERTCKSCKITFPLEEGFEMMMRTGAYCYSKKMRARSLVCKYCTNPEVHKLVPVVRGIPVPFYDPNILLCTDVTPVFYPRLAELARPMYCAGPNGF